MIFTPMYKTLTWTRYSVLKTTDLTCGDDPCKRMGFSKLITVIVLFVIDMWCAGKFICNQRLGKSLTLCSPFSKR